MKKIFFENSQELAALTKGEISRTSDGRYSHRLHIIFLLLTGFSAKEASQILREPLRTVQYWAQRFRKMGFAGLKEGHRSGRKRKLSEEQMQQLAKEIRKPTSTYGYNQGFWDGPLLKHHLEKHYQVELTLRSCQIIFHRLKMTLKRPRPKMAGASPEAQEDFKKKLKT